MTPLRHRSASGAARPRLAVAAIFRNEFPYVIEWLAHHRLMGVDTFFIADNDSNDGTRELLEGLATLGYIRLMPFSNPAGQPPQLPAYAALMQRHSPEADWVAFIDADEFLMPTDGNPDILTILERLADRPEVGAIAVNWAIFGSSGHTTSQPGLVVDRFVHRATQAFDSNYHYKSIVRCTAYESVEGNPHFFRIAEKWRYVHADGSPLVDHPERGKGLSEQVCWRGMRLNHYVVKSREEFDRRKAPKGSASRNDRSKGDGYFANHDRNEVRDPLPDTMISNMLTEIGRVRQALAGIGVSLTERTVAPPEPRPLFKGVRGHVDSMHWRDGALVLQGWALRSSGRAPATLVVDVGGQRTAFTNHPRLLRPDVQRQYPSAEPACGFVLAIRPAPQVDDESNALPVKVFAGDFAEDEATPLVIPVLARSTTP